MEKTIKQEVETCFIERNLSTIQEKRSYCVEVKKMKPDQADHLITQIVINLHKYLLPLKVKSSGENPDHPSEAMHTQEGLTV